MIVIPANANSVVVRMIKTGCLKSGFDSTYPIRLNGIITQDEYHQSIENINQSISSRIPKAICGLIFIICAVGGMILIILGGAIRANSRINGFPILITVGLGVVILAMIVIIFGCCIIRLRRATQMRRAIANESMKYSKRSPTPCSWRLDNRRIWGGSYRHHHRSTIIYRLIIEIGHSVAPGNGNVQYQANQSVPRSASFISQQNNMLSPSPYYEQSTIEYCSHCGIPRQNPTAKFCSSCGQQINI